MPIMFSLLLSSTATLKVDTYSTSALHGTPKTSTIDSLDFSIQPGGSTEITGTLDIPNASYYAFSCRIAGGQIVFVWIEDHLVCHTDPPFGNTNSSIDGSKENPLSYSAATRQHIVIHIYASSEQPVRDTPADVSVRWASLASPLTADAPANFSAVPPRLLTPGSSAVELQRRSLQRSLQSGWNLWLYNLLSVARLPQSFVLTTAICQLSTGECLESTRIEDTAAAIRVGPFAIDQSYWQYYVAYKGLNLSLSYLGGDGPLRLLVEPLGCDETASPAGAAGQSAANCSDFALVVQPRFAWYRRGSVLVDPSSGGGLVTLSPLGMPPTEVRPTARHSARADALLPEALRTAPHLTLSLGRGAVALCEGNASAPPLAPPSLGDVRASVAASLARESRRYAAYGALSSVKEGLQAATFWNYVYSPAEYGPFLPVSRSWNFVKQAANNDWAYVIFDWDNIFATYMTSLDPTAKDVAYSNFIQVVRSRTSRGFVPNYSAGGSKSVDRTEPPIGAKVLLELHRKYSDTWLVRLLFDDLKRWSDWFLASRAFGPARLISLGSDRIDGFKDAAANAMQGARYESGLDNSPMYDGAFFNATVAVDGAFAVGQMELYDVGMASMFVQEAESLSELARLLGRADDVAALSARAAAQRALIKAHLWDAESGIFVNRFWNGTFYRRISPTSFYALMAGAATDEQAAAMVEQWLHSPERFCIAKDGDMQGNHDDCYWGLPSIQRSDPAFPPLGYWRGYVWGPMAMLTYWSLQQYDHVPAVRAGRKALCSQMTALMLSQWRAHRHICENYSPHKTADDHHGDCSGTKFYHWGALTGMITLVEEGYYHSAPPALSTLSAS